MTSKRHLTGRDVTAPKQHCRWCKKPVQPPKRTWCGQACVDEYLIRASPQVARRAVWERDNGICQGCQFDLKPLHALPFKERHKRAIELGLSKKPRDSYWEADHIIPVVEGGGACGLENLRVLCLRCHRAETAALAKRRADARRQAEQPKEPPVRVQGAAQLSLLAKES